MSLRLLQSGWGGTTWCLGLIRRHQADDLVCWPGFSVAWSNPVAGGVVGRRKVRRSGGLRVAITGSIDQSAAITR
jgi:hypothetical protein